VNIARVLVAAAAAAAVLATATAPATAQQPPGAEAPPMTGVTQQTPATAGSAPVLRPGFVLEGVWVASGVVWLDWGDVDGAAAYELMYRSADGWVLLSENEPVGGVAVASEGSGARVVGLPIDASEHWFAVRARNAFGVSVWSDSVGVEVPAYARAGLAGPLPFDPFTAPTLSGINLERLREAVDTIAPGEADCSAVPALDVTGVTAADPPSGLDDVDAGLAVAEVTRVAGGCLVVEYVALAGRTVNEVRELLAAEPSVHAVGAPVRGLSLEYGDYPSHGGGHVDDGGGEQWHLAEEIFKDNLWKNWEADSPVTVAVLDTGVTSTHPDLFGRVGTGGLDACHRRDRNGHGTHVAGIVAADNDDRHVAGVAPAAEILSVRVLDQIGCEPSMTATAAVAAAVNAGARVINMSFKWPLCERDTGTVGGIPIEAVDECDPDMYDPDDADDSFELALRAGSMLGVVAITSVGNDGEDADGSGPPNQRNGPAVYPDVISVAAFDENGQRLSFSTANDLVDIAAPGGKILSTVPLLRCNPVKDTDGDGNDEWAPLGCGTGDPLTICPAGTSLREFNEAAPQACAHRIGHKWGTSMASPFVAGVVAHMLNRYPQATVGEVRRALEQTALKPPDPKDAVKYPSGSWTPRGRVGDDKIVVAPSQGPPTTEYGRGIVNPAAAIATLGAIVEDEAPDGGGFVEVDAGARHSCGRRAGGRVRCWGDNGVAANTPGLAFDQVSVPTGPADHACGINMSALEPDGERYGTALCWSADGAGVPRVVKGTLEGVVTGFAQSCGLRRDGGVVCWDNDTGAGRHAPDGTFQQVSGGWLHFCGLRADNSVQCWGNNAHGQTDAPEGVAFVSVDAGGDHSCGVTVGRGVRCWGAAGALAGMPAATQRGFLTVDAGHGHSCATALGGLGQAFPHGSGRVTCWGDDTNGQADAPGERFVQVSAGWRHSCGRRPDATVVCWGSDGNGQAPQARLSSLSLMSAGGAELISFEPAVTDYTVVAEPGEATLARTVADHDTSEPESPKPTPPDSKPGTGEHEVMLADGLVIEVTVEALFGFGESRTYRINIVEPPRLASLRVIPGVPGPQCRTACPELALDPVFDSGVFDYTVLAPADLSRVTVAYTEVGGRAAVWPDDADGAVAGYQVALRTDEDFVAVAVGGSTCGIKTDSTVACWPGHVDAPVGSFGAITAGTNHFCGIRTGGSVVCWGSDRHGETDAPSGSFNAVAAGYEFSCGIRTGGSVVCWGDNSRGQTDAPSGSFNAVAAGSAHSCGIRTGGSVVCWGSNSSGRADAPSGSFSAIAAGSAHSCGIRTDKTVVCWGSNSSGRADAPSGSFSAVAAGGSHSCGVRTGKTVVCWGSNRYGQATVPSGSFNAVAAGLSHSCGVRTDNSVVCWGNDPGQADAPAGSFDAVSAGYQHSCGIRPGGGVVCWGDNSFGQADAPAGSFDAVAAAGYHTCGIRTDASVECWGSNFRGQIDAPSGSFRAMAARWHHSCGVRTDARVVCWGRNSDGQTDAPSGSFSAVASGHEYSCGLRTNASVVCWGNDSFAPTVVSTGSFSAVAAGLVHTCGIRADNNRLECWGYRGQVDAPAGSFSAIAVGRWHSCGIRTGGSVVCWGSNRLGQTDAPAGPFSAVSSGYEHSCGIRTDNSVVCWGARSPSLEPAASETVTLTVTSRARGTTPARYRVTVARPEPDWERAPRLAAQQSEEPAAAPSEPPPECEEAADPRICLGARPECIQDPLACPQLQPDHRRAARPGPVSPDRDGAPPNSDNPASGAASPATSPTAAAASPVVCPTPNTPDGAVAVTDSVLRAAINATLNKAPGSAVTAAEMAELTSVAVQASPDGGRVVSLSGLEHAANLTELDLHGHSVSDISPLACLDKLNSLGLGANTITDIDPLKGLSSLTTVDVSNNQISDISALSAHSALAALDLSGNNIASVASLSQLSSLRSLNLGRNQITGLGPLRGLSSLERLYLYDNQITDLVPLADLSSLTALYLDHNDITDISALSGLTSLAVLGLGDNSIADITPLASLVSLEVLYVFDNDIADASALAALGGLRVLWIDGNDIASPHRVPRLGALDYLDARHNLVSDVAPLDTAAAPEATVHREPQRVTTIHISDPGLRSVLLAATGRAPGEALDADEVAAIERLDVTGVELGGLSELRALKSLRRLNLHHNSLTGLESLPALGGLDTLFVDFNNITDLAPLTALRGLRSLGLVGNNIADLEPLAALTGLESLYLSANNIADLTALTGLRRLHHLRLTTNNIADLEPLKELTALTQLHLRHNNITDLEPLKELTGLIYLDLRDNDITSLEPLAGLTGLRDLHIGGNHITDYTPLDHLTALTIHGHD